MPLFGHHRPKPRRIDWVPGLVDAARARGWQPVDGAIFPHLHSEIHDLTCNLYGFSAHQYSGDIGETTYADAFRGIFNGRAVTVASAFTYIEPGLFQAGKLNPWVSVCAVELPTLLLPMTVQPRRRPAESRRYEVATGDGAFDEEFRVIGTDNVDMVLTPDVRRRIMNRDDWAFTIREDMFACVAKGRYQSVDEVNTRITETLELIGLVPETVIPHQTDRSADDIVARIRHIDSIEDAMAFLQNLTPADRQRLAFSNTPLAAFADVTSPEEAMMRLTTMPVPDRMQLLAMFQRIDDQGR